LNEGDFPRAMAQFANEVSLPVYYHLSDEDVHRVYQTIREAVNEIQSAG
jgi:dTDP-4-amino-4,6-dideoxygalactose transaminase